MDLAECPNCNEHGYTAELDDYGEHYVQVDRSGQKRVCIVPEGVFIHT